MDILEVFKDNDGNNCKCESKIERTIHFRSYFI